MSEQSPSVRWLRTATGAARYVAWGDRPGKLYRYLDYLTGARGKLERAWLRLPSGILRTVGPSEYALAAAEQLHDHIGPDSSCLFLWTGYYKTTEFVGPVRTGTAGVFVKCFARAEDANAEATRAVMIGAVADAAGAARTLPPTIVDNVVRFPLVERRRMATPSEVHRVAALLASTAETRSPNEREESDRNLRAARTFEQLAVAGVSVSDKAKSLIGLSPAQLAPAHGDITPWNVLIDRHGRTVLIDYDEVAWLPAHFDVVYAHSHADALAGRVPSARHIIEALSSTGLGIDDARDAAVHGLSEQVMRAADSLRDHPLNSTRLKSQVESKLTALEAL